METNVSIWRFVSILISDIFLASRGVAVEASSGSRGFLKHQRFPGLRRKSMMLGTDQIPPSAKSAWFCGVGRNKPQPTRLNLENIWKQVLQCCCFLHNFTDSLFRFWGEKFTFFGVLWWKHTDSGGNTSTTWKHRWKQMETKWKHRRIVSMFPSVFPFVSMWSTLNRRKKEK